MPSIVTNNQPEEQMARIVDVYEVVNPSFRDIPVDRQIEYGICDWVARLSDGKEIVGETRDKAIANAKPYL